MQAFITLLPAALTSTSPIATLRALTLSPRYRSIGACIDPSERRELERRFSSLRDLERQEIVAREKERNDERRADLELRRDLSPEDRAARRLCDALAKHNPPELPLAPWPDLSPHDVVIACLCALQENDQPDEVARNGEHWGHRYNWEFFNGMVRANWPCVDEFVREANNNPSGLANCDWFETEEETISIISATPTRGAICKMVVHVRCRDARPLPSRKFLWTLQQERRPPQAGCWLISSVLPIDRSLEELTL